ncbi:MAG TPA: glycosyltransferase family 4 protein [Acidimicrobiales bacterium]|nr:glycosyltransferase family 4 protein [Acidimicrobiales bacterium]
MKITFWWNAPSSYFDACNRALVDAGHQVSVVFGSSAHAAPLIGSPYGDASVSTLVGDGYDYLTNMEFWSGQPSPEFLRTSISDVPDVLVVQSWGQANYVRGAAQAPEGTLRLVAADSPWRGSPKQLVGMATHRRLLRRAFDGAWVAGTPQRRLLQLLGFRTSDIFEHLNCCDTHLFTPTRSPAQRVDSPFLFVGRLVENKGLAPLAEAYRLFRGSSGSSRRLRIVGSGPVVVRGEGIDVVPYRDPPAVQSLMDDSYALVHPAFLEHWGVVVHEAASMGLPLILSPFVHAGTRFLSSGINGFYAGPEIQGLARAMEEVDRLDLEGYERMSRISSQLGSLINLESWVENFEQSVERLQRTKRPRR